MLFAKRKLRHLGVVDSASWQKKIEAKNRLKTSLSHNKAKHRFKNVINYSKNKERNHLFLICV